MAEPDNSGIGQFGIIGSKMIAFTYNVDPQNPVWPDLDPDKCINLSDNALIRTAMIRHGMQSGKPSIVVRIDLQDGQTLLCETAANLFINAALEYLKAAPEIDARYEVNLKPE